MQPSLKPFDQRLQLAIRLIIPVSILLLLIIVLQYPPALSSGGLLGLIGASGILLVYGYLALGSPIAVGKPSGEVWRRGAVLGMISGIVLSVDLISSYFLQDWIISSRTSLLAYGIFLLFILISGFIGARQTGQWKTGLTTAAWCVLVTLMIWFFAEFASYLLFSNTSSGAEFIRQEMQLDFARSGATDYQAFTISDFYGAGFFHLLLGLFFTVILGSLGAFIGLATRPKR